MYDIDIEYGHVYLDRNNEDVYKSIAIAQGLVCLATTDSIRKSVLIDNYNKQPIFNLDKYLETLTDMLKPDLLYYEKDLCQYANDYIDSYMCNIKKEYFKKDKKEVSFFNKAVNKIPLMTRNLENDTISYSCPYLTMIWYAMRLKGSKRLINILNKEFKSNEDKVLVLLDNHGIDSNLIKYQFYN